MMEVLKDRSDSCRTDTFSNSERCFIYCRRIGLESESKFVVIAPWADHRRSSGS